MELRKMLRSISKPPWRTIVPACLLLFFILIWYPLWSPGKNITDGRHDLKQNGIWIQHGWLGDDSWFERNNKDKDFFRAADDIKSLAALLKKNHIKFVFPHMCPCKRDGMLPPIDADQARLFLSEMNEFKVLPWVGGVLDEHAALTSEEWRKNFVQSITDLLNDYPQFAGVHINIEPLPSGTQEFILLLQELREGLPEGKVISIAAYPPPTWLHRFPDVHWDKAYYQEISRHADQIAVMMYDTAIQWPKVYQHVMVNWTKDILTWVPDNMILLGVPAYDDEVDYHNPRVENIENGLLGIHAGLSDWKSLPENYQGTAIYCEWTMTEDRWDTYKRMFLKN